MENSKVTLKDVINYEPEKYLSDDEVTIIRNTFKGNPTLMRVLRKIMIPTMADPNLPIEELSSDFYFAAKDWSQIPADEAKILMVARQEALQFIIGGLIKLNVIANVNEESEEEKQKRQKADSAK